MYAPPPPVRKNNTVLWVVIGAVMITFVLMFVGIFAYTYRLISAGLGDGNLTTELARADKNGFPMDTSFITKKVEVKLDKPDGTPGLWTAGAYIEGYDLVTATDAPLVGDKPFNPKDAATWLSKWEPLDRLRASAQSDQVNVYARPEHGSADKKSALITIGSTATFLGDVALVEAGQGQDDLALSDLKLAKHVIQMIAIQNSPSSSEESARLWARLVYRAVSIAEFWSAKGRDLGELEAFLDDSWLDKDMTALVKRYFIYSAYEALQWPDCYTAINRSDKFINTYQKRKLVSTLKLWNDVAEKHSINEDPVGFAEAMEMAPYTTSRILTSTYISGSTGNSLASGYTVTEAVNLTSEFDQFSQLGRAALAAIKYHTAHHTYPQSLTELGVKVVDPVTSKPVHYKGDMDQARFYFVGENGRDDGGYTRAEQREEGRGSDDIYMVLPMTTAASN